MKHALQSFQLYRYALLTMLGLAFTLNPISKNDQLNEDFNGVGKPITYGSVISLRHQQDHAHGHSWSDAPQSPSYLTAGPLLTWQHGNIGYAAFGAPAHDQNSKLWLIKGSYSGGDPLNAVPNDPITLDSIVRLQSVEGASDLGTTSIISPYSKIFEGTGARNTGIFSIVNLRKGDNYPAGQDNVNWRVTTPSGVDQSEEFINKNVVTGGQKIVFEGSSGKLSIPSFFIGVDPYFAQGNSWENEMWDFVGGKASFNPGSKVVTVHYPKGDSETTWTFHADTDDEKDWVVRKSGKGPHNHLGFGDRDLSIWSGEWLFRCNMAKEGSAQLTKGEIGMIAGTAAGAVVLGVATAGLAPAILAGAGAGGALGGGIGGFENIGKRDSLHVRWGGSPWKSPHVAGSDDGFGAGFSAVCEVSARRGDSCALNEWNIDFAIPYASLLRLATRNGNTGRHKYNDLANQVFQKPVPMPENEQNKPIIKRKHGIPDLKSGGLVKLRHQESGRVLSTSNRRYMTGSNKHIVSCEKERSAYDWWRLNGPHTDGIRFSISAGGPLPVGSSVRLENMVSKENLSAADVRPPVSVDYHPDGSRYDREVSTSGAMGVGTPLDDWKLNTSKSGDTLRVDLEHAQLGGRMASMKNVMFPTNSDWSDWRQEVTLFNGTAQEVGNFGVWLVERYIDPQSTSDQLLASEFVLHPQVRFKSLAMGNGGVIFGISADGRALKFDPKVGESEELGLEGVKKVVVGQDDTIAFLKEDGSVLIRTLDGTERVLRGPNLSVALGGANSVIALRGTYPEEQGMLMRENYGVLLGSAFKGYSADTTSDGMRVLVAPDESNENEYKGRLIRWDDNKDGEVEVFTDDKPSSISIGSRRFITVQGENRTVFKFAKGEELYNDHLYGLGSWEDTGCKAIESSISAEGVLAILAGQPNDADEYQVFTKNFAPWPPAHRRIAIKVAQKRRSDKAKYLYAVNDPKQINDLGFFKAGAEDPTDDNAQFNVVSYAGYVGLKAAFSGLNLAVEPLEDLSALNNAQLQREYMQTSFVGESFSDPFSPVGSLEKFMFYSVPGKENQFRLQSMVTKGYLRVDDDGYVRTLDTNKIEGQGVPIDRKDATTFEFEYLSAVAARVTSILKMESSLDALAEFKAMFEDKETFADSKHFVRGMLRFVQRKRRTARAWMDFVDNTQVVIDDHGREFTQSAAEILLEMISPAAIENNPYAKSAHAQKEISEFFEKIRELANPNNVPKNIGLVQNLRAGHTIALKIAGYGLDSKGRLSDDEDYVAQELYLVYDKQTKSLLFEPATSLSSRAQFVIDGGIVEGADPSSPLYDKAFWEMRINEKKDAPVWINSIVNPKAAQSIKNEQTRIKVDDASEHQKPARQFVFHQAPAATMFMQNLFNRGFLRVGDDEFGEEIDVSKVDFYLRSQDVETLEPLEKRGATRFEFVIIDDLLKQLTAAAELGSLNERVDKFTEIFYKLETLDQVERFIEMLNYVQEHVHRVDERTWKAFVQQHEARTKLAKLVEEIKERFKSEYLDDDSLIKEFVDRLHFNINVTPKRNVMTLESYAEHFDQVLYGLDNEKGYLMTFIARNGVQEFIRDIGKAVKLWERRVAVTGHTDQTDPHRERLEEQRALFKKKMAVSLTDEQNIQLDALGNRLRSATVTVDPIIVLEEMESEYLTFSPDDKDRFIGKLHEIYEQSTTPQKRDIFDMGQSELQELVIHGLRPSQIERIRRVLRRTTRPTTDTQLGGQFFDDQESFEQIMKYFTVFNVPTFEQFLKERTADLEKRAKDFNDWVARNNKQGIENIQQYAIKTLSLLENWGEWKPDTTNSVHMTMLSTLLAQMEHLLAGNEDALARRDALEVQINAMLQESATLVPAQPAPVVPASVVPAPVAPPAALPSSVVVQQSAGAAVNAGAAPIPVVQGALENGRVPSNGAESDGVPFEASM
jgi:hypothetical protein